MKSLGATLKNYRSLKKLTLKEVENELGISNAYLSQLENDKIKQPSAHTLYKLAKLYSVNLDTLLFAAGIIDEDPSKKNSTNKKFLQDVAFSSDELTKEQRKMVLEYLEFLKSRNK
jgi:transcriptional regulator with XRE-family HTH domain